MPRPPPTCETKTTRDLKKLTETFEKKRPIAVVQRAHTRKFGDRGVISAAHNKTVFLSVPTIEAYFQFPLHIAADKLDVCKSVLKR